jgi:hypothetical protein
MEQTLLINGVCTNETLCGTTCVYLPMVGRDGTVLEMNFLSYKMSEDSPKWQWMRIRRSGKKAEGVGRNTIEYVHEELWSMFLMLSRLLNEKKP